MKILKKIFAPKVVRVTLNILEEIGLERNGAVFQIVRSQIEDAFLGDYDIVTSEYKKGISPRQQIYFAIANVSSDYLGSGRYHLHKGILNPNGEEFLQLFNEAMSELAKNGAVSDKEAEAHKAELRGVIKEVGW